MKEPSTLRQSVETMTTEQLTDALYRDPLTGALNRRAFEALVDPQEQIAIVDMDGLKYINTRLGYRTGDSYLQSMAHWLRRYCGADNVFRLGGDEFAVVSPLILAGIVKAKAIMPGLSFGIGRGVEEADQALRTNKLMREVSGQRAHHGDCPPWLQNEENKS